MVSARSSSSARARASARALDLLRRMPVLAALDSLRAETAGDAALLAERQLRAQLVRHGRAPAGLWRRYARAAGLCIDSFLHGLGTSAIDALPVPAARQG